ncbi:MAG: ABC transporter ATP-binding protein [Prolixibacteraceae bacterium]|nr:ABC transporter ATP-binding protein [Prolixibacteraceae bacterium]
MNIKKEQSKSGESEKVIILKDLYKTYHSSEIEVHALNGINLNFERGEFTAIVGPSGSGKTTLLNLIGGLDSPDKGNIIINDQSIINLKEKDITEFRKRNIGFIFQSYNLLPVLTARENTELVMILQDYTESECKNRTEELLKEVGLEDRMNDRPSKLSGGQQQRVAVARALASKPQFILADEPTANLDSKSTEGLLSIMEKLNKEENITFIFSTHDQRVVKKARRIIKIEDGKVISDEN